jgi:hypothetical protein
LEPLVAGHEFKVLQVKEKFGNLRFYVRFDGLRLSHADDAISRRIDAAMEESFHTCEVCGKPGDYESYGQRKRLIAGQIGGGCSGECKWHHTLSGPASLDCPRPSFSKVKMHTVR